MALIDKDHIPQSTLDDDVEKALDVNIVDFTDEEFREATFDKQGIVGAEDDEFQRKAIRDEICDMSLFGGVRFSPPTKAMSSADKISTTCDELKKFLLVKNERYGDSALNPIKVFSKGDASDKIDIRMDDKLSRIIESDEQRMNDFVDLTGYLVLKCIDKGWTDFSELLD